MENRDPPDAGDLRRRAEQRLEFRKPAGQLPSDADPARLVRELEVRQVELEIQQEALQVLHVRAEALLDQYTRLYDFSPLGYLTLDRVGAVRRANVEGARLLGIERAGLVGRRLGLFVDPGDRPALNDFLRGVFAAGTAPSCVVTPSQEGVEGRVLQIEGTRSSDGEECSAVVLDVTARRRAEQALKESEERLRLALSAAGQGLFDLNVQTGDMVVNPEYATMLGFDPAGFHETYQTWLERLHPDDREHVAAAQREYFAGLRPEYRVEFRQRTRAGDWQWTLSAGKLIARSPTGQPLRMIGTHTDIAVRKTAELRSQQLAQLYAALSQCNQAVVRSTSEPDLFAAVCRAAVRHGGMHMAWIGMVDEANGLVRPVAADGAGADDLDGIAISVDAGTPAGRGPTGTAIRERRPVWCQDFRNDASTAQWHERGERHGWAASAALPLLRDGRPVGALTLFAVAANAFDEDVRGLLQQMAADITFGLDTFAREAVRRRTEVALRDSEYRWRFALEGAGDGLWDWDMLTGMVYFSRQWKAMLGFAEDEITDRFEEWEKRVHPDDLPQAMAALQAHLDGRTPLYFNENRVGCKDGSWKWILERGLVVRRDAGGKPVRMIGTHTDVTARRQAESSLRLRSAALDAAANAIVITDRQGTIEWVNRAFSALTGYGPEEALGRNPRDLVKSGVHGRAFYEAMWQTLVAGGVWEGELTNRRKDGSRYVEEQTITPVKNANGEITHFIGVKRDLTEYKRLQQQFLQAQKMEVVGRLAGGVAHDFNNLLTVINGTADLALIELSPDDPLRAEFALIQQAGSRAGRLTRQLLAFSRKQILAPAVLNVGAQVANAASMLRRLIGEDIDLVIATPDQEDLDSVLVDPGQLEQVLLNLVVNARDAMPTGGSLTIETRNVTLDAAFAAAHPGVVPGPYVLLSVTDTGVGMTADVRARIFEPFFTTKERGKGTGLGLATVYGIVHQSGGCIVVETEPGHGASFKIFLPKVEPADTTRPGATPPCVHGTETVLLVEDEDGLCQVATRMLLSAGYTVIQARSGQEALATLDHRDGPVHLLFADVVMPGMSGPDLAARLAGRYPDMRVLFTSGHVGDDPLSQAVRADTSHFIAKPYTVADVTRKIRDVLDAPPAF